MGPTAFAPGVMPPGADFRFDLFGAQAHEQRMRCEGALDALGDGASHERVVLTAHLVAALRDIDPAAAAARAAEVRNLADDVGTPAARAYGLVVHGLTNHAPGTVAARVVEARRILAAAHAGHAPELASVGHFLLLTGLLEHGKLRALDLEMSPYGESLSRFPHLEHARHVAWFRCLRLILDGRSADAERMADAILASADEGQRVASQSVWTAQVGTIRWMQGRILEMEPAFLAARQAHPKQQIWAIALAWLWQLQGREAAARALYVECSDFATIPRDHNFLVTVTILAQLAARIGTRDQVEALRAALLPYASQLVSAGFGLAFWGTIARTLGMLSIRLGRMEEARSLFNTAIDVCARSGAQAWLAEVQLELADLELATGGDPAEAAALARQAEATARALDFPELLARAETMLSSLPRGVEVPQPAAVTLSKSCAQPRISVLGSFDVVAADASRPRWTSRKARALLKLLVARRGVAASREEFMHELWPDIDPDVLANRFSVALSTVRRALDPGRMFPTDAFIVAEGPGLQLDMGAVWIDVEEFLTEAQGCDIDAVRRAVRLYAGDAFAEEPYADWAEPLRHRAQTAFCVAAHRLARHEARDGGHLAASELYRRILEVEPDDRRAHDQLLVTLAALGATGQARSLLLKQQLAEGELIG